MMKSSRPSSSGHGTVGWLYDHLRRRAWPLSAMVVFLVVSMAYSFWWDPLIHHSQTWIVPGDIWSTFRAAHWVGWGALGGVYGSDTQLVTFPGIAVILAPVAMASGALGLGESIAPIFLSHPTSWYLLGPANALLGSSCLVALDAMAEELGAKRSRRAVLCWLEGVVIFQVLAIWGHPEDLVALTLSLYAFIAIFRQRWTPSAWLWGAAIVVQPLVVLMFPLAFIATPRGRRLRLCVFGALPSVVFVGTPLLSQWSATSKVLFHQANFEYLDHATPWVALSPRLSDISVGAGPGRALAILAAIGMAILASRWRPSAFGLLWLCAVALSLRCFFEAVMVSFYLGPPLAVIVMVATCRNSWARMIGAWLTAALATFVAFHRLSEWAYWTPMVILLAVGLALAWPGREALGWSSRTATGSDDGVLVAMIPDDGSAGTSVPRGEEAEPPVSVERRLDLDPLHR